MPPKVALLFPPLVNTAFGDLYPSTAVLAGFLEVNRVECRQLDLNAAFALTLINEDRLRQLGDGHFFEGTPLLDAADSAVASARLLLKNRDHLFDAQGRRRFNRFDGPGDLLAELAEPYRLDLPLEDSIPLSRSADPRVGPYRNFYAETGLEEVTAEGIVLIGISVCMGPQLVPALILADQLKTARPDLRIVMGGPVISLLSAASRARLVEQCASVDALVVSDGEFPLLQFVRQASCGPWAPWEVAGATALKDGTVSTRPPAPGPVLGALAFASYEQKAVSWVAIPRLSIVQTRGCYWGKCAYCDYVELYEGNLKFRGRAPEHFLAEIEHQMTLHGVRDFSLVTESIPPGFARRFADLVIQRGLKIRWGSFCMVDRRFTPELLARMAEAGCDSLVVGLETLVDRILRHVDKQATRAESFRFIGDAYAAGIELNINLIPDLPTTTRMEAMAALDDLESIATKIGHVTIFPFEATVSSRIGRSPEAFGLIVRERGAGSGQAQFSANHLEIKDEAMNPEVRQEVIAAYREFAKRVNARPPANKLIEEPDCTARLYAIARNDFDLAMSSGCGKLRNWRLRASWDIPIAWARVIERLESTGRPFTREEFAEILGDVGKVDRALRALDQFGVVQPVNQDAPIP